MAAVKAELGVIDSERFDLPELLLVLPLPEIGVGLSATVGVFEDVFESGDPVAELLACESQRVAFRVRQ